MYFFIRSFRSIPCYFHGCALFSQSMRDMVYARRIKVAQLGPQDEVEGVIERAFEWIFFEMPIEEVCGM